VLFLILAAQHITLPVLRAGSLKPDFAAQMNEGGSAATKVKLVISPEGVPVRCDVAFSNGPQANGDCLYQVLLQPAGAIAFDQAGSSACCMACAAKTGTGGAGARISSGSHIGTPTAVIPCLTAQIAA
jgi:hypothetical protein